MRRDYRVENIALLTVAWLSISSSSIIVILSGVSALEAAFWRLTLSLPLLAFLSRAMGSRLRVTPDPISLASGFLLAVHFASWMQSLFLIPVSLSTSIVVMYPVIALVIENVFSAERTGAKQALGMILALVGVFLVLRPASAYSRNLFGGCIFSLVGAFSIAGYFLLGRKARGGGQGLFEYAFPTYMMASLTLLPALVFKGSLRLDYPGITWLYLLLLAVVPMIGGHTVMNYLLGRMRASTVTSIALGEPLGASVLARVFLGQPLPPGAFLGVILVPLGLWITLYYSREVL